MNNYALIIPALDEAGSIAQVIAGLPAGRFPQVIVVDNGSRDRTAEVAREAGARVVVESRRGYGRACMAGIAALSPGFDAVAFMDADLSDEPGDLERLLNCYEEGAWDLVIGSRVLGSPEPGSLTLLQRFGNALTTWLICRIWGVRFTDLGPMRVLSRSALDRLHLSDPDFGWNVEMQAKAARLKLRTIELAVAYRRRRAGKSKISGTVRGSIAAGAKILLTVYRCWRAPL